MNRRPLIIAAIIVVLSGAMAQEWILPAHAATGDQPNRYQQPLYESCTVLRGSTPTPEGDTAATAVATTEPAAVAPTTAASADSLVFYKIVGEESEACYQVGEVFANGNQFNLAIGVTKTIEGDVAIDLNDVANSQIGDMVINVSEFKSDSDRRDGIIRERFLESNKYPFAKLTEAKISGLPEASYKEGSVLKFKVVGKLELHGNPRETTFDATARLESGTLVVIATADVKMSEYGFDAPNIAGVVKANDDLHIVLNLVARESNGDATPAAQ